MKNIIIKGITLTTFLILIVSFIAYKSGYFSDSKSSNEVSPNKSYLNNQTGNTFLKKRPDTISIEGFKYDHNIGSSKTFRPFKPEDIKVISKKPDSLIKY